MTEENTSNVLLGCDYDAATASALKGKDIVALVTNKDGDQLLAVSGQQSLSYNMSQETTSAKATKDANGGWTMNFHGAKSWDASIDGLYSPTDEATQRVAYALANDEFLCLKICKRTIGSDGSITYQPLRMGLAIVTSDNFSANVDDSATYSMQFTGSGKPWLYENATTAERDAAKFVVSGPDTTLSALTIGSLTLSPTFAAGTTSYTASTSNATNTVTATATDSTNATVTIKNGTTTVTSGSSATWVSGTNTVTITVENGGYTKVYTVVVTYTPSE